MRLPSPNATLILAIKYSCSITFHPFPFPCLFHLCRLDPEVAAHFVFPDHYYVSLAGVVEGALVKKLVVSVATTAAR